MSVIEGDSGPHAVLNKSNLMSTKLGSSLPPNSGTKGGALLGFALATLLDTFLRFLDLSEVPFSSLPKGMNS